MKKVAFITLALALTAIGCSNSSGGGSGPAVGPREEPPSAFKGSPVKFNKTGVAKLQQIAGPECEGPSDRFVTGASRTSKTMEYSQLGAQPFNHERVERKTVTEISADKKKFSARVEILQDAYFDQLSQEDRTYTQNAELKTDDKDGKAKWSYQSKYSDAYLKAASSMNREYGFCQMEEKVNWGDSVDVGTVALPGGRLVQAYRYAGDFQGGVKCTAYLESGKKETSGQGSEILEVIVVKGNDMDAVDPYSCRFQIVYRKTMHYMGSKLVKAESEELLK